MSGHTESILLEPATLMARKISCCKIITNGFSFKWAPLDLGMWHHSLMLVDRLLTVNTVSHHLALPPAWVLALAPSAVWLLLSCGRSEVHFRVAL
ncbi:hypothetical protein ROHU_023227 [Labeo rohita]|uniref:Uncharacterized protein n=1 Tax=Labeo rohita TaxID=84645 RepID=A0A498MMS9_LABRO|nr:hypothetical protein ROHU_023227 [Labeo rohita]